MFYIHVKKLKLNKLIGNKIVYLYYNSKYDNIYL